MRFFIVCLFLGSCAPVAGLNLGQYPDPKASPDKFIVCHGYGCSSRSYSGLTPEQWQGIKGSFKRVKSSEMERNRIAQAISKIERYVGDALNLKNDQPKAPIVKKSNQELDCIDETINTTKYLNFLEKEGLLKFHTVGRPAYKGLLFNGTYPHNTATLVERETKQIYVVDSYIHANGEEPVIRTLEDWYQHKTFESGEI